MATSVPLTLRLAEATDNHLLADLGAETFSDTFAPDNSPADIAAYLAEAFGPEKQARELADPANRFLIAEIDGTAVGYAMLNFGAAPAAVSSLRPMELRRIYARQAWIGKGIGARLMQACLDEAAGAGCDVAWLGVWERNTRAIAFYERWGFAQAGALSFQLGADLQRDLLMVRPVKPN